MGRSRVVQPEIVRLPLSGGDFVDVKKELNAGDYWDLIIAQADRQPFAKILAYVIGWSFVGDSDPIPYSLDLPETLRRDTVRSLDKSTMRELIAVIDRHEQAVDALRDGKKKETPGVSTPSASYASVS